MNSRGQLFVKLALEQKNSKTITQNPFTTTRFCDQKPDDPISTIEMVQDGDTPTNVHHLNNEEIICITIPNNIEDENIDIDDQSEFHIYNNFEENIIYEHQEEIIETEENVSGNENIATNIVDNLVTIVLPDHTEAVSSTLPGKTENLFQSSDVESESIKIGKSSKNIKKSKNSNSFKRKSGAEYLKRNGVIVPKKKKIKSNPCENRANCCNDCTSISSEVRQRLFEDYWKIPTQEDKDKYLSSCIEKRSIKRKRSENSTIRKCTHVYSITCPMEKTNKTVCKQFLINTLDITASRIRTVVNNFKDVEVILNATTKTRN